MNKRKLKIKVYNNKYGTSVELIDHESTSMSYFLNNHTDIKALIQDAYNQGRYDEFEDNNDKTKILEEKFAL